MKKMICLVMAMAMVLSLAACSSSTSSSSAAAEEKTETEAVVDDTESTESDRPYYVRDEDEITGTLVVYTTMNDSQQEVLLSLWNKYYPNCTIEIQADSVGTLATRIRSDETCDADVVIGGMFASDGETYHDILQPYTSIVDDEQLYHDESGYYTYYDVQVMCLVVNTALKEELGIEINGYEDLLQEELAGKIILAAPDAASSGWRQLQTILATMGDEFDDDKAWEYIANLMPSCYSTTSSKDVYNLVASGEYVVGLSYESSVVALIKDGAEIECIYMEEGNTAMAGGAAICKNSTNLEAAKAMIDLLASAEFQDLRIEVTSGRGSNGNCSVDELPDDSTLGLVDLDYDYLAENKDAICTKWNDLWAELH